MLWEIFRNEVLKVSTLSEFEVLQVTASVWSIFDDKWNCNVCVQSERHDQHKKIKGCISTPRTNYQVEGFRINKCLGNFTSKEVYSYFEMHRFYEKGVMPFSGAMSDQPAKLIELMNIIGQLKNEKLKEIEERERKKMK